MDFSSLFWVLLPPLIWMFGARMMGPRARAFALELTNPRRPLGLFLRLLFWLSDRLLFWWPNLGALNERLDQQAAERRASSHPGLTSSADLSEHKHDMRLVKNDGSVLAVCVGCRKRASVRPGRSARRNVVALERWLDRLDARLQRDSTEWPY